MCVCVCVNGCVGGTGTKGGEKKTRKRKDAIRGRPREDTQVGGELENIIQCVDSVLHHCLSP